MSDNSLSKIIESLDLPLKNQFLWFFMVNMMLKHPLPWTIEEDWSAEVYDAKKVHIMNFRDMHIAQLFCDFAEKFQTEEKEDWEALKKELGLDISG